jgi:hypothetical protein
MPEVSIAFTIHQRKQLLDAVTKGKPITLRLKYDQLFNGVKIHVNQAAANRIAKAQSHGTGTTLKVTPAMINKNLQGGFLGDIFKFVGDTVLDGLEVVKTPVKLLSKGKVKSYKDRRGQNNKVGNIANTLSSKVSDGIVSGLTKSGVGAPLGAVAKMTSKTAGIPVYTEIGNSIGDLFGMGINDEDLQDAALAYAGVLSGKGYDIEGGFFPMLLWLGLGSKAVSAIKGKGYPLSGSGIRIL